MYRHIVKSLCAQQQILWLKHWLVLKPLANRLRVFFLIRQIQEFAVADSLEAFTWESQISFYSS